MIPDTPICIYSPFLQFLYFQEAKEDMMGQGKLPLVLDPLGSQDLLLMAPESPFYQLNL